MERGRTTDPGHPAFAAFQTDPKRFFAGSIGLPPAHFDFGRVRIHASTARAASPDLPINEPGDEFEQEAERVAEQVMRAPDGERPIAAAPPMVSRKSADREEDDEERLQREPAAPQPAVEPPSTSGPSLVNESLRSAGQPLEAGARRFLEGRFGHDFGHVRVHADSKANESAAAVEARAYTVGSHIVFGDGWYEPGSEAGRRLLAHELTHVVQQTGAGKVRAVPDGGPTVQRFLSEPRIQRFGEPENLPQITYISGVNLAGGDARSDAFLKEANNYHQFWGLRPRTIKSMEGLLDDLGKDSGVLDRIRIVSHAWENRLFFPLFEGSPPGIDLNLMKGIGQSEVALLTELVGPAARVSVKIDPILNVLRDDNPDVLKPFGLDAARSKPSAPVEEFIVRAATLWLLVKGKGPADAKKTMRTAIERILPMLRQRLTRAAPEGAQVKEAEAKALEDAIVALEPDPATPFEFNPPPETITPIAAANKAFAGGFSKKLEKARKRFKDSSWIDIRGCRVGDQPDYMQAVSQFFGGAGSKPHVSAPDWVQLYRALTYKELDDADLASAAGDHGVKEALDHWADITGTAAKLAALTSTAEKFKAYLDEALVLPVRPADAADNLRLYVKKSLRKKAFDAWLSSQWKPAAPELAALQKAGLTEVNSRWVAGLSDKLTLDGVIVVTPDPEYKAHIQSI
jgi:hypothetical protein